MLNSIGNAEENCRLNRLNDVLVMQNGMFSRVADADRRRDNSQLGCFQHWLLGTSKQAW
jgi:hypothetical protein